MTAPRTRQLLLMVVLAGAVLAVYGQVYRHGFIEYDDPAYVRDNFMVHRGLTWAGVRWAFSTNLLGHWHPLIWLSFMLDVQLFGPSPAALHLINVALHVANTLLLFMVWYRMSGDIWPSFIVAALFGVHPLHVESVAWISERKDVVSTFFWFLTMWAYAGYTRSRSVRWYAATLVFFALGLMAKVMLVTLPFVLLLLDVWPLRRVPSLWSPVSGRGTRDKRPGTREIRLTPLLIEKLPLFALAAIFSAIAYTTQANAGAIATPAWLPFSLRAANAMVAYVMYLISTVWPVDLAILYPFETVIPTWQPIAAVACLALVSVLLLRLAPRHPYALVGWLWYLGTLVPVIGFVQIGVQSRADRYTYVPLIGVFVIVAWGGAWLVGRWRIPQRITAAIVTVVIGVYAAVAWAQVGCWVTGESLLQHAVRVTRDNCIMLNNLGVTLGKLDRGDEATALYREALRIKPDYADAHSNLGLTLWRSGKREEALEHYRASLRYAPEVAKTHSAIGALLAELGQRDEGFVYLKEGVRLDPESPGVYLDLGQALYANGSLPEAIEQYQHALQIDPDDAAARNGIGIVLGAQGHFEEAAEQFRTVLRHSPEFVDSWNNLGLVLNDLDKPEESVAKFAEAVRLAPNQTDLRINYGKALRGVGRQAEAVAEYEQALRLAPDSIEAHYLLGVVLTEIGRHQDAIEQYERVLQLDPKHAQAHNDYGVTLYSLGRISEAIPQFEKALELDPDLGDAQINLEAARGTGK